MTSTAAVGGAQTYNTTTGQWSAFTPTPTPAPAPPAPATTPANTAVGRYPSTYTPPVAGAAPAPPATSSTDKAESTYQSDAAPQSDADISSNVQGLYASEIASIQNYYQGLLGQQGIVNQNESGKTRATAAAQGELGQDMGNAAESNQDDTNAAANAKIVAEEGQAEGAVTDKEASAILSTEQSQTANKIAADEQAITYQSQRSQTAQTQMQTIAGTTDLATLPQDEYDSLYAAAGFATPEQFNTYYNALRSSALTGGQTLGDATTGVFQKQIDGTWKNIIPAQGTIGDPTTGVYQKGSDGTYQQVIKPQTKVGSIGAAGSYIYDPSTGGVTTIKPQAPKIVSSGGVIYSVDPTSGQATQLTANKTGWTATGSSADNEKASIMSYVDSLKLSDADSQSLQQSIQSNPQAYYTALGNAAQSGFYNAPASIPTNPDTQDATDNASNAAQDASDAASSAGSN